MNLIQQPNDDITIRPRRVFNSRIVQNFVLVWLDSRIDDMNDNEFVNTIHKLQRFVNSINTFIDVDECIDFVTNIKEEKVLMIISNELGANIIPITHNIPQINAFHIFCKYQSSNKQWQQQWPKVQKISTGIEDICEALKQDIQKCERDSMSISFILANNKKSIENFDQLDPTYMYTQILKEILLTLDFNEQHFKDFIQYYRTNFADNQLQLNNINEFEKDYKNYSSIRWYTYGYCIYPLLNRALRLMEVDTIIKMGFFICDLHREITRLHSKQSNQRLSSEKFVIYRGQSFDKADFERMQASQGGLISFNNFLSTTKNLTVARQFANSVVVDPDLVGVLFVMTIDPSIKSTPFAMINDVSHYKTEEEILFSMHTVFRIDNIIKTPEDNRLWQIDLIQTTDNDSQLNVLTERIRKEIQGATEWDRLGKLLIKLGHFNKADELYQLLLDQTENNDRKKIHLYHQLGWSKKKQKQYKEALQCYKKSFELKQKLPSVDLHSFAVSLNEIGSVYEKMDEYAEALFHYKQALEMEQTRPSADQSGLATSYSKIGSVYEKIGEYTDALTFHRKALEIRQKVQPIDNSNLAYCYSNIASVYKNMGDFSEALDYYEKTIASQQKALPSNHPDLAHSYSSIGFVYDKMGQYEKARQFKQRAIDIGQRSLPNNHPQLQLWRKSLNYKNKNS